MSIFLLRKTIECLLKIKFELKIKLPCQYWHLTRQSKKFDGGEFCYSSSKNGYL